MKASSRKAVVAAIAAVALVALAGTASAKWSILNEAGFGDIAVCTDGAIFEKAFFEADVPYPAVKPPATPIVLPGFVDIIAYRFDDLGNQVELGRFMDGDAPYQPIAREAFGATFYYSHRGAGTIAWPAQSVGQLVLFDVVAAQQPEAEVGDCSIFGVELLDHLRPKKHDQARLVLYGAANFNAAAATGLTLGALETVAAAPTNKEKVKDFNGDGYADLKLRFDTQDTGATCSTKQLLLQGSTPAGPFAKVAEAALRGC
jgi:hypothetical protein